MLPTIDASTADLGEVLSRLSALSLVLVLVLGSLPFWQLAALAFLFRFGIERIPLKATRWFGPAGAGLAMLIYFGHRLLRDQGDFEEAFAALVRSLLLYQVVWGVLTAVDGGAAAVADRCKPPKRFLTRITVYVQSRIGEA